jgi:hypothetical protein
MTRIHAVAALATAALAAPVAGAAAAPTLQTDRPCYTPNEDITFTGAGYSPSGNVNLFLQLQGKFGSNLLFSKAPAVADAAGAFSKVLTAPDLASSDDTQEKLFVSANDEARLQSGPETPDSFAAAQTLLSAWDVAVDPWDQKSVDPRKTVQFRAYGFAPGKRLFAHYVLNGTRVATAFVGNLTGPCGDLKKRMREFPFRPVKPGTYAVYFQASRVFDKRVAWVRYSNVTVTKDKAVA